MLHTINYSFNGGNITTEGGTLILETFLEKIGFSDYLASVFTEEQTIKAGKPRKYSKADNIESLIKGFIKGHATPTAISRTRGDILGEVLIGQQVASQATLSRAITSFTNEDEKSLRALNKQLLKEYFESLVEKNGGKKLACIEISDDSTKVQTYGKQEGSAYISHYRVSGYHPDMVTEDTMGLIMEGILRDGNVYSSNGSEFLIKEVLQFFAPYAEKVIFRGDSAYAKPEILNVLNNAPVPTEYYIKAKTYKNWYENCEASIDYQGETLHPLALPADYFVDERDGNKTYGARYFSFTHQVKTWSRPERIEAMIEYEANKPEGLFPGMDKKVTMLITNGATGETAYQLYAKRGKQEKLIEEFKNDSFGGQLSQQGKAQNACMFMIKIISHNLMQILRLTTLHGTKYANCRVSSLRMLLVQVGGKLIKTGRRWMLQLSSTFAYKRWFTLVMERIPQIQFRLCIQ